MKPKIAFFFVEAGLGHVMPMKAALDVFERKYGDKVDVIKVSFFRTTDNPDMRFVEDQLISEVKQHNKDRFRAFRQFLLLKIFGQKISMKFLMESRYKRGLQPSLEYIKSLDADLAFNTHFATLYYCCKLKSDGLIDADIVTYCPDPHIGQQWDKRVDKILLSSESGKKVAIRQGFKKPDQVGVVPFLIREEVKDLTLSRQEYREQLGMPKDKFTILLCDGAYGAGRLKRTVLELLNTDKEVTIIAVCGKNEELYAEFKQLKVKDNISFFPFGFTSQMLYFAAACDLFIGKAGASNLAEPCYFGAPQIINFCASPVEQWIAKRYIKDVKSAFRCNKAKKIRKHVENFIENPELMKVYEDATKVEHRTDGPEQLADILYERLMIKYNNKKVNE